MFRTILYILIITGGCCFNLSAQEVVCDPETDPFCVDPYEPVPIDGGVTALIAGAAALGYRALKKKNTED